MFLLRLRRDKAPLSCCMDTPSSGAELDQILLRQQGDLSQDENVIFHTFEVTY